jgi:hypothetical protein
MGLFTTVPRRKDENIIAYTGEQLSRRALNERYPGDRLAAYAVQITKERFVDARDPQRSSVARYANDCRRGVCNCRFSVHNGVVSLRATRAIPAGSELFVRYGADYWRPRRQR